MKEERDIRDDEIRIIGQPADGGSSPKTDKRRLALWACLAFVLLVAIVWGVVHFGGHKEVENTVEPAGEAPVSVPTEDASVNDGWLDNSSAEHGSVTTVSDTVVDEIRLTLYTPHNAVPELVVGHLDTNDPSIVLAVQAADVRRDNGGIVGAFVLRGEPLAWGLSKSGYCAIIGGRLHVDVAANSPLFEQATETAGYFFRQYPLVAEFHVVENQLENEAVRRALCNLHGQAVVAVSADRVRINAFAQALADLGVRDAIYLVGGDAFARYTAEDGIQHSLGQLWHSRMKNVNYLLFRKAE